MKTSSLLINVNSSGVSGRYLVLHSTWSFNNVVKIKLTGNGRIHKIFHVTDIENYLEIDSLEEYINNASV